MQVETQFFVQNVITKPIRHTLVRFAPAILLASLGMGACNSEKSEEPPYEPAVSVAVSSFSLSPNAKVMANLDSVFFSIDLDHAVIFNADSLPAGTPINKLVPKITFPSAVTKAEIEMTGGSTRTGVVDFKQSPTDSIDFSGNVKLTLSTDDALTKTYTIKVNVHKMVADSIMWDKSAIAPLPSAQPNPLSQRTVSINDLTYELIQEANGTYTLATCNDLPANNWNRISLSLPFTPQVRSLSVAGSKLYILASDGTLYSSTDARTWTSCGVNWTTIIGGFGENLLGITNNSGRLYHDIYPRPADYNPVELPADFPTKGLSEFNSFVSKWAADPIGLFVGGERNGNVYGDTWAYDGDTWAKISNRPLPNMQGILMVPYFNYRKTATSWIQTEFSVLLAIGGKKADGTLNRTVYLSYDNGVNWMVAGSLLQLPEYVPSLYDADALIHTSPMSASLDSHWQTRADRQPHDVKRIQYFIDGSEVEWDCPYIYLFGGNRADGNLNPQIWRAVLARLTFAPLF